MDNKNNINNNTLVENKETGIADDDVTTAQGFGGVPCFVVCFLSGTMRYTMLVVEHMRV